MVWLGLSALLAAAAAALVWRWLSRRRRRARKPAQPRYPVVLAHGFLGFDELAGQAYFRGIAERLSKTGARVYTPRVPPLASIEARAFRLAELVRALPDTRVNIVAHSMGGLDARYAIARLGLADRVASLTTIGTPHLGTPLADFGSRLLSRVVRMMGRFFDLRAFVDLTSAQMQEFNRLTPDAAGVAYGSVVARSGRLRTHPLLGATHAFLSRQSGENDGVVPAASQPWGEVVRSIDADHWAQIGWSLRFDAPSLYAQMALELGRRGL